MTALASISRVESIPAALAAPPQRIAIVTDAWLPQMNGVVRTLATTCELLRASGHEVLVISPDLFASVPCPTYPEIRLALSRPGAVAARLADFAPGAIHIATEGPLRVQYRRAATPSGPSVAI